MAIGSKPVDQNSMFGFVNSKPAPQQQQQPPKPAPAAPQGQNTKPIPPAQPKVAPIPQQTDMHFNVAPARPSQATYIAAGTALEGTLSSQGDIEIDGNLKGDIVSQGKVVLHTATSSNITAADLLVDNCQLTGDVHVSNSIVITNGSEVKGNVFCGGDAQVAGVINGDIQTSNYMSIDATAVINGNVEVGMMSVARGAVIIGNLKITTK